MKRKNFEVAAESLDRCREIASKMDKVIAPKQMDILWSDFLISSQRFFSRLAAASEGKSAAWLANVKKVRRDDELLAYIHQARHADEHGLEKIASPVGGDLAVRANEPEKSGFIKELRISEGLVENFDGENAVLEFKPADAMLRPVKNCGRTYSPPSTHLGKPWTENNAQAVAKAALAYMEKTVSEAKAYLAD